MHPGPTHASTSSARASAQHSAARPSDPVRVLVDDVPELGERVREAARRARETDRAVELVEPDLAVDDHEGRARRCRRMDEALAAVRDAAPGVEVRVAVAVDLPRPRSPR
ncbi:hypothetical protein ASG76_01870 [Nocardioides sp. Soil774]|uniref:hypothetical protein n=1 Tax=Nocardioides sp. Soil774 TaxID=1736408 RepID=UPI000701799A|nr:hypothetical protein [Nocardioides sp. Soil774]KRE97490.1 hypothetical protein ASG76_01870 [Nocardioides sp. Soil774]